MTRILVKSICSFPNSWSVTFQTKYRFNMPNVKADIEYLKKLPLYEEEKPYWCFLTPQEGFDPDVQRVDNLEWETHKNIIFRDIRQLDKDPNIEVCGFKAVLHQSNFLSFQKPEDVKNYKIETEELLKQTLGAVYVYCYDSRLRKNVPFIRTEYDLNDLLLTEGPARGVHNGGCASWRVLLQKLTSVTRHNLHLWSSGYKPLHV